MLNLDPETNQVIPVFLKLESCNGTVTWCRPPWSDLRKLSGAGILSGAAAAASSSLGGSGGGGSGGSSAPASSPAVGPTIMTTASDVEATLDTIEDAVSPGLRLKYTNRSGESIAYTDEGYIELTHIKGISLTRTEDLVPAASGGARANGLPEAARKYLTEPNDLKIVYGSSLAENRSVHFLCPPEVASVWERALPRLSEAIRAGDPRMVWLKDQYLFLYFQDDLCMGPLAADAIKVRMRTRSPFVAARFRYSQLA